jgi:hypothetical protein
MIFNYFYLILKAKAKASFKLNKIIFNTKNYVIIKKYFNNKILILYIIFLSLKSIFLKLIYSI